MNALNISSQPRPNDNTMISDQIVLGSSLALNPHHNLCDFSPCYLHIFLRIKFKKINNSYIHSLHYFSILSLLCDLLAASNGPTCINHRLLEALFQHDNSSLSKSYFSFYVALLTLVGGCMLNQVKTFLLIASTVTLLIN